MRSIEGYLPIRETQFHAGAQSWRALRRYMSVLDGNPITPTLGDSDRAEFDQQTVDRILTALEQPHAELGQD